MRTDDPEVAEVPPSRGPAKGTGRASYALPARRPALTRLSLFFPVALLMACQSAPLTLEERNQADAEANALFDEYVALADTRKSTQARRAIRSAIELRKAVRYAAEGDDGARVLVLDSDISRDNLVKARMSRAQGQYHAAVHDFQIVLGIQEELSGLAHPSVASALRELADLVAEHGDYHRAEELLQRAIGIQKRAYGPRDPRVRRTMEELAAVYQVGEQFDKAARLIEYSLAKKYRSVGPSHPEVRKLRLRLDEIYTEQGASGRAEAFEADLQAGTGPTWLDLPLSAEVGARSKSRRPDYLRSVLFMGEGRSSAVVMRWHERQMPLKVHLPLPPAGQFEHPSEVMETVRRGVVEWSDVVKEGVPSFEFVDNTENADIPIVWAESSSGWWVAFASYNVTPGNNVFRVDRILIAARYPNGRPATENDLYLTMIHEVGHALGLMGHSPEPSDVMYEKGHWESIGLTPRDKATLRALYGRSIGSRVAGARGR